MLRTTSARGQEQVDVVSGLEGRGIFFRHFTGKELTEVNRADAIKINRALRAVGNSRSETSIIEEVRSRSGVNDLVVTTTLPKTSAEIVRQKQLGIPERATGFENQHSDFLLNVGLMHAGASNIDRFAAAERMRSQVDGLGEAENLMLASVEPLLSALPDKTIAGACVDALKTIVGKTGYAAARVVMQCPDMPATQLGMDYPHGSVGDALDHASEEEASKALAIVSGAEEVVRKLKRDAGGIDEAQRNGADRAAQELERSNSAHVRNLAFAWTKDDASDPRTRVYGMGYNARRTLNR
ncbi:MAG: hypothetical protein ABH834_00805 [Candidatus Altiarchaeota archaeon]